MIEAPTIEPLESASRPACRSALFFFAGCFMARTDGCHVRAMQTLQLLLAAGLRVTIYSFREHSVWPWTAADEAACAQRFPGARLVLENGSSGMAWIARARTAASVVFPRMRPWILESRVPGITPALDRLTAKEVFDVAVVSYAAGLTRLNGVRARRVIVDAHDLTALERVRRRPGVLDLGALLAIRKEVGLLAAADRVWCISNAEFWFLNEVLDSGKIRFVPPTLDDELTGVQAVAAPEFDLLFIGSNNRWNADALLFFLDDFRNWNSPLTLAVAGRVSDNKDVVQRASKLSRVHRLGFQSDLAALYARTRAAICPVEGTGTKIKMIEALAASLPVFAANGALRGLAPGYERCVLPLDEKTVTVTLRDRWKMEDARSAAQAYARTYAFDNVLQAIKSDLD